VPVPPGPGEGRDSEFLRAVVGEGNAIDAAFLDPPYNVKINGRTDGLRSYRAAMNELGNSEKQEISRWANNRVENSHLSFRRRERAMLRFRRMKTLQKFASVHANLHYHFNQERHLVDRHAYKDRRSAALAEWQPLMA